jgi:hypothetical protein
MLKTRVDQAIIKDRESNLETAYATISDTENFRK